jgi:hypothetical protein
MKPLQDLVLGCNKVTEKTLSLTHSINIRHLLSLE